MTDGKKLRQLGFDKIAFLLLLLAGFFFAELLVLSRSSFKLSRPILLPGCGLAVSAPAGSEQTSDGFEYNDNEFRLSAGMRLGGDTVVSVHWRYFIVPFKRTIEERFEIQASTIGGTIEKTGSEKMGQLTFDYARIVSKLPSQAGSDRQDSSGKMATLLVSGTTQLPDGRTLTLEVAQKDGDIDLAEKLFRTLAASAVFTPESSLADGRKLMAHFRQKALADIAQKEAGQNYYYITSDAGQVIGFITDAITLKTAGRDVNSLTAVSLYFIHQSANPFAQQSLLHGEPNLQTFKWLCQQSNLLSNRRSAAIIELDGNSTLAIQSTAGEDLPEKNVIQNVAFTSTMLPEILFDTFTENFLQSDFNSVMVDLVLSDGRVSPALITRLELPEPKSAAAVKIALFGTEAIQQTTYFDSGGQILLSKIQGSLSYKIERTQRDRLAADFPGWREKIEQIEQHINENPKKERK